MWHCNPREVTNEVSLKMSRLAELRGIFGLQQELAGPQWPGGTLSSSLMYVKLGAGV